MGDGHDRDEGADDEVRATVATLLATAGVDPPADEIDRLADLYPGLRRSLDRYHAIDVGDEVTAAVLRAALPASSGGPPGDEPGGATGAGR